MGVPVQALTGRCAVFCAAALLLTLTLQLRGAAAEPPPDSPVIVEVSLMECLPRPEICGDGIDQDCNGVDLLCAGSDRDRDGYAEANDCDDTDRKVYPGVSAGCSASCGEGTRRCGSDGKFTACSCSALCEAVGGGRCFYISATKGDDQAAGSFAAPWKSFKNVVTYYSGERPSRHVTLGAGDVVYLMDGVYKDVYLYDRAYESLFLRNVHGTAAAPVRVKAYPGAKPVVAPGEKAFAVHILQSSHISIEGLEVSRGWGAGVMIAESESIELARSEVHQIDGLDNDNVAGVYLVRSADVRVHHSVIHDNYDRTNADTGGMRTENSRNIVLFGGGNARIDHNVIYQTPPISAAKTGVCITYKHASDQPGTIFEVDHNIFWNCFRTPVGSGTSGSRIHHNLILDSGPIVLKDFGGTTRNSDNSIEFNTIIGGKALYYEPTTDYAPIGSLSFKNNIVVDRTRDNFEDSMITIHPYGSDALFQNVVEGNKLQFGGNCYYNSNFAVQFALFARNGGGYGVRGGEYGLPGWQSLGYDAGSTVADPRLDASHVPQNPACAGSGWSAP